MAASSPPSASTPIQSGSASIAQRLSRLVQPLLLLAPAGVWLALLLVIPALMILNISLIPGLRPGEIPGSYGLGNYLRIFDPINLRVMGR